MRPSSLSLLFLPLLLFASAASAAFNKWEATNFCKCICFQTNSTILHLDLPDNPAQPCLSCTKKWCLNQNLPICAGASLGETNPDTATGKEGDVEARCFQRDSPRDQLVVTLFLLTVFGLLLVAGIKNRIAKIGPVSELPWQNGRRWLEETFAPGRPRERYSLGQIRRGSDYERLGEASRGDNDSSFRA